MLRCKKCQSLFIGKWFNKKMQFGKLKGLKFSDEEIKKLIPICPKCFAELKKSVAG